MPLTIVEIEPVRYAPLFDESSACDTNDISGAYRHPFADGDLGSQEFELKVVVV
jgi:hypothetical protein